MKQPHMAYTSCDSNEDIRKKGILLKIKTSKKKLFVLRDESSSGPARLEYYDSAKKLGSGGPPRRSVVLRNCFSINAKSDNPRHPFAIVLYTNDDCFVVGCDSDAERQDWLKALHELRRPGHCSASARAGSAFRHVWPVTVQMPSAAAAVAETKKDAACSWVAPSGDYRLCMSASSISLQPCTDGQKEIVVPLDCIRCCGHGDRSVYVEVDTHRSATELTIDELWLNAEDAIIAQSIHDTLVNLLNSSATLREPFRSRAHTSVDLAQRKKAALVRRGTVLDCTQSLPAHGAGRTSEASVRSSGSLVSHPRRTWNKDTGSWCLADEAVPADCEYMVMSTPTDEGYLDMAAAPARRADETGHESSRSMRVSNALNRAQYALSRRLDVVHSFVVVDEEDNSSDDYDDGRGHPNGTEIPKRAYSVGSKPMLSSQSVIAKLGVVNNASWLGKPESMALLDAGLVQCAEERSLTEAFGFVANCLGGNVKSTDLSKCSAQHCLKTRKTNFAPSNVLAKEYLNLQGKNLNLDHSGIRPRTSTFPWQLLRTRGCAADLLEPQRPRSASNGNTTQIHDRIDAVKRRLRAANDVSAIARIDDGGRIISDPIIFAPNRCGASDLCEYVEMGCNNVDYVDMTLGKSMIVTSLHRH